MSRLTSRRQQTQTRRLLLIAGSIVILFVAVFQVGLRSLINATLFVNTFQPAQDISDTAAEDSNSFFGTFSLDDPPGATREATLIVTGTISGYDKIIPFLNGAKQSPATVKQETFDIQLTTLKTGENSFYLVATTKDGKHTKKSSSYVITYRSTPPKLEFESPHDRDTVTRPDMIVQGTAEKGVTLRINRSPVVVNWNGHFQTTIQLKEGENTIEAVASDDAGNTTEKKISVTYRRDE